MDDIRVKGIGRSFDALGDSVHVEHARIEKEQGGFKPAKAVDSAERRSVYFDGHGRVDTPVIRLRDLEVGEAVMGPAICIDETQTILVEPKCEARATSKCIVLNIMYD